MNKSIIVVGSEGGMGKEIVKQVTEKYGVPICCDTKTGFDITNESHIEKLVKYVDELDGIVMAHGITNQPWGVTIDTNLTYTYHFLNSVINKMTNGGSIVNITSLSGHMGFPSNPQYCASKGGLRALTKALAVDLGKYNIRVNNVCPGYIRTDMTNGSYNDKKLKKQRDDRMILDRWGEPKDIANAVMFLLSDESSYITGIDLIVDGGWSAKGL